MDLLTAFQFRQVGYTSKCATLIDASFLEAAEDTLLKSNFSPTFCDFKEATKSVFILTTSFDGRYIASGHGDHNVYVSEVTTGTVRKRLTGHKRTPWALTFHPTCSDLLASGCLSGEVRVYDFKVDTYYTLKVEGDCAIASLTFHPRFNYVAVASADKVLLWKWAQSYPYAVCRSECTRERLRYVRFDPTGYILYTGITNVRKPTTPYRYSTTPPDVMPFRFREMFSTRNELIKMRSELNRNYQKLLERYNSLITRYNALRERHPELAELSDGSSSSAAAGGSGTTAGTEPIADTDTDAEDSRGTYGDANNNDNNEANPWRETLNDASNLEVNSVHDYLNLPWIDRETGNSIFSRPSGANRLPTALLTRGNFDNLPPVRDSSVWPRIIQQNQGLSLNDESATRRSWLRDLLPPPVNVNDRSAPDNRAGVDRRYTLIRQNAFYIDDDPLPPESSRSPLSDDDPVTTPPLSPIALEGLQDSVAYAREITSRSMEDFVRRHLSNITYLQESYRGIADSARALLHKFEQTSNALRVLQERVEEKYGVYFHCSNYTARQNFPTNQERRPNNNNNNEAPPSDVKSLCMTLLDALRLIKAASDTSSLTTSPTSDPAPEASNTDYRFTSLTFPDLLRLPRTSNNDIPSSSDDSVDATDVSTASRNNGDVLGNNDQNAATANRWRILRDEMNRLMRIHRILIDFDARLPMKASTRAELNARRTRIEQLSRELNEFSNNDHSFFLFRDRLIEEISRFSTFFNVWKNDVMAEVKRLLSNPEPPSGGGVVLASRHAEDNRPGPSGYVPPAPAQHQAENRYSAPVPNNDNAPSESNNGDHVINDDESPRSKRRKNNSGETDNAQEMDSNDGTVESLSNPPPFCTCSRTVTSENTAEHTANPRYDAAANRNLHKYNRAAVLKLRSPFTNCYSPANRSALGSSMSDQLAINPLRRVVPSTGAAQNFLDQSVDRRGGSSSSSDLLGSSSSSGLVDSGYVNDTANRIRRCADRLNDLARRLENLANSGGVQLDTAIRPAASGIAAAISGLPISSLPHHGQLSLLALRSNLDRSMAAFERLRQNNRDLMTIEPLTPRLSINFNQLDPTERRQAQQDDPEQRPLFAQSFGRLGRRLTNVRPQHQPQREFQEPNFGAPMFSYHLNSGDRDGVSSYVASNRQLNQLIRNRLLELDIASSNVVAGDDAFSTSSTNRGATIDGHHVTTGSTNQRTRSIFDDPSQLSDTMNYRDASRRRLELQRYRRAALIDHLRNRVPWHRRRNPDDFSATDPLEQPRSSIFNHIRNSSYHISAANSAATNVRRQNDISADDISETVSWIESNSIPPAVSVASNDNDIPENLQFTNVELSSQEINVQFGRILNEVSNNLSTLSDLINGATLDTEDNQSSFYLHRSVNRVIAGDLIGTGDVAVANNILDTTCRIQYWPMENDQPPGILLDTINVILSRCKINNDNSVSVSEDGRLMAAFVENDDERNNLWAHTVLKVVSLCPEDRGSVLYQKIFSPNAISVSISPAMGHLLIGVASKRYLRFRNLSQTFAQVYRMCDEKENITDECRELKLIINVEHRTVENGNGIEDIFTVRNESLNCAVWLKTSGHGFCYGTNKGRVLVLTGKENEVERRETGEKSHNGANGNNNENSQDGAVPLMRMFLDSRLNLLQRARQEELDGARTVVI